MHNLSGVDIFSLIASILSIVLAVIAIVLSLVFFFSGKRSELQARIALNNIERVTKSLDSLSMKLINRLTTYVMTPSSTEQSLLEMVSKNLTTSTPLSDADKPPANPTNAQLNRLRVDNLISAFFYASVSNISLQTHLPGDMAQLDVIGGIVKLVDQSKQDALTLKRWILEDQALLASSPLKNLYDEALKFEASLKSITEFYAALSSLSAVSNQPPANT